MTYGIQEEIGGNSRGDSIGLENVEKYPKLTDRLEVVCLRESAVIPQRSTQGSAGYDISAACSCVIPAKGKNIVQTGLAISLPSGVYARIAPRSGLAVKKFIDVGAGVVDSDYRGEVGVVLFNHSAVDFHVQVGDRIAQLILEKIKTPAVQEVEVLSATVRGSGGFGSSGLRSSDQSVEEKEKEKWVGKEVQKEKERIVEGRKEKILPSSHTASWQGSAGPSERDTSGTLRQATNQDSEVAVVGPGMDVVYPSHGDSAIECGSTSGYPAGETSVGRPLERHPESDGGGISSVVRIRGTVVALAGRVRGRSLRVLIDSGSTGNYISARCQTELELEVKPERDFERLTLADGTEVHAQGYVQFVLRCGGYCSKILARVFPNLQQKLILGIPWLVKENPTIDWATRQVTVEKNGVSHTLPCYR